MNNKIRYTDRALTTNRPINTLHLPSMPEVGVIYERTTSSKTNTDEVPTYNSVFKPNKRQTSKMNETLMSSDNQLL